MCKNILIPDFLDDDYNIQLCYKPVFQEIYAPVKTNNLVNKTIQKKKLHSIPTNGCNPNINIIILLCFFLFFLFFLYKQIIQ